MSQLDALPPRERLSAMMATGQPQHWMLERAMREWARLDPIAAANVRAADSHLLRTVIKAYRDYGFSHEDARLRAERPLPRESDCCTSPTPPSRPKR